MNKTKIGIICLILLLTAISHTYYSTEGKVVYSWNVRTESNLEAGTSLDNIFSLALMRNGNDYYIVGLNGTHIIILDANLTTINTVNAYEMAEGLSGELNEFSMKSLSSNITDLWAAGLGSQDIFSIGGGGGILNAYIIKIDAPHNVRIQVEKFKIISWFSNSHYHGDYIKNKDTAMSDLYLFSSPSIKSSLGGNITMSYVFTWRVGPYSFGNIAYNNITGDSNMISAFISVPSIVSVDDIMAGFSGNELIYYTNQSGVLYLLVDIMSNYTSRFSSDDVYYYNITDFAAKMNPVSGEIIDLVTGDFNADGEKEIALDVDKENGTILVIHETNETYNSGVLFEQMNITVNVQIDKLIALNFSGADDLEFAFIDPSKKVLYVYDIKNQQVGSWSLDGNVLGDLVATELDGDGYMDIALLTNRSVWFVLSNGTVINETLSSVPTSNMIIADVDKDGYLEYIYASDNMIYRVETGFEYIGNKQFGDYKNSHSFSIRGDIDGDRIGNWDEVYKYGTSPYIADTDGDGLSDYEEVFIYNTDPSNVDTDGDGFSDNSEILSGLNPNVPEENAETNKEQKKYVITKGEIQTLVLDKDDILKLLIVSFLGFFFPASIILGILILDNKKRNKNNSKKHIDYDWKRKRIYLR
ncbi:MAG: hypothetical protein Q6363_000520 [Candidatus Njordarchaeota archaeon]